MTYLVTARMPSGDSVNFLIRAMIFVASSSDGKAWVRWHPVPPKQYPKTLLLPHVRRLGLSWLSDAPQYSATRLIVISLCCCPFFFSVANGSSKTAFSLGCQQFGFGFLVFCLSVPLLYASFCWSVCFQPVH